jgi:3-methyladenine DNA glycosylase Tag
VSNLPELIIPPRNTPKNDIGYFEQITKAVFQAGFSYKVVQSKWKGFRKVFLAFDPKKLAFWTEDEIFAALESNLIIRNIRKIRATVLNAQVFNGIVNLYGSFQAYLQTLRNLPYPEVNKQISKQFKWLGRTGTFVFLYCVNEDVPEWDDR